MEISSTSLHGDKFPWRSRRDIFTIDALLALRTLPVAERISLETRRRGYMLTHRTCEDTVFGGARPSNVKRLTGGISAASTHTPLSIYTHIERKKGDPIERQTDRQTDRQKRGGGVTRSTTVQSPAPPPSGLRRWTARTPPPWLLGKSCWRFPRAAPPRSLDFSAPPSEAQNTNTAVKG